MNINQWLRDNPRSCRYGAPMGMSPERGDPDRAYKFHLQRLRMVDGAYTLDGTYWGGPADLWCARCIDEEDGEVFMFVRAGSRDKAKAGILDEYTNARFFK